MLIGCRKRSYAHHSICHPPLFMSYQHTPNQSGWPDQMLYQVMGVPADDLASSSGGGTMDVASATHPAAEGCDKDEVDYAIGGGPIHPLQEKLILGIG